MATSGQSQATQTICGISPILIRGVVEPITSYCVSKGWDITVEEICEKVLLMPSKMIAPSTPVSMPSFLPNGNVPMASSMDNDSGSGKRGRKVAGPVPESERCPYILVRGLHKGEQCSKPREGDNAVCKDCLKKKGAAKYMSQGGQMPAAKNSGPGALPGGFVPPPVSNPNRIKAIPIKGSNNLLRTVGDGFIVQQQSDSSLLVIKVQKEEGGEVRELTSSEKEYAKSRGLSVVDTENAPSIPSFPGAAPTISTSSSSSAPPVPDIPMIPGVNNRNTPPMPSVGHSSVPSIPQVSQNVIPQINQGPPPVPQMIEGAPPVPQIPQSMQMGQGAPQMRQGPPQIPQVSQGPQQIPQLHEIPTMQGPPQVPQIQSMS